MYIQKVIIENIRSISHFEMDFPNPAGWHVLIGDNGTGKTTILKAIGTTTIRYNLNEVFSWLKVNTKKAQICLWFDERNYKPSLSIEKVSENSFSSSVGYNSNEVLPLKNVAIGFSDSPIEVFSTGYGSLRIAQENGIIDDIKPKKFPQILAHETLLGEKNTLMSAELWLKDLQYAVFEGDSEQVLAQKLLDLIVSIISESNLLPYNVKMEKVGRKGILFRNDEGTLLNLRQLSDGFRSILNITIDLIYRMVGFYGEDKVIKAFENPQKICSLSGIVLIDEIDAHLHPTWQTRIGQWFTQYFPNIQFIVTTHSPLICRACEKGSIWRLAAPDSEIPSGEIVGTERERLIYGNILDAYGTEAFGENTSIGEESAAKRNRLGELYPKSIMGLIAENEEAEFEALKAIFPTFQFNPILMK